MQVAVLLSSLMYWGFGTIFSIHILALFLICNTMKIIAKSKEWGLSARFRGETKFITSCTIISIWESDQCQELFSHWLNVIFGN